jgi:cell fate regulator YaaT (PSP1 superfamily)
MTGCCGRLMCCLSYEDASAKIAPRDTKKEVSKEVKK